MRQSWCSCHNSAAIPLIIIHICVADACSRLLCVACAQSLQDGSAKYDFIEVMACPGGCIGGGGQPRSQDKQILSVSFVCLLASARRLSHPSQHSSSSCAGCLSVYSFSHVSAVHSFFWLHTAIVCPLLMRAAIFAASAPHRYVQKRQAAMYDLDERSTIRRSHENPLIQQLYKTFLGEPNSHKAHDLLHTHYVPGGVPDEK